MERDYVNCVPFMFCKDHSCFVKSEHKRTDKYLFIVFDVETMLMDVYSNAEREHVVNLVCASSRCHICKILHPKKSVRHVGIRKRVE